MLLKEFLFRPLGVAVAAGFADHIDANRVARPFLSSQGKLRHLDHRILQLIAPAGPAGSLCLSSEAMATWMQFLLKRGKVGGVQVVSAKTVEDSWKPRVVVPLHGNGNGADVVRGTEGLIVSVRRSYALGWGRGTYRGKF